MMLTLVLAVTNRRLRACPAILAQGSDAALCLGKGGAIACSEFSCVAMCACACCAFSFLVLCCGEPRYSRRLAVDQFLVCMHACMCALCVCFACAPFLLLSRGFLCGRREFPPGVCPIGPAPVSRGCAEFLCIHVPPCLIQAGNTFQIASSRVA